MRRNKALETRVFKPSAPSCSPSAPVDGKALSNSNYLQIAGFQDAIERGRPAKRAGDWRMPATVQGQRSGCGAAYQSGGRLCVEAVLATESTIGGELHIAALNLPKLPCDSAGRLASAASGAAGVCGRTRRRPRGSDLNAASSTREEASPLKEIGHSRCRSYRGGLRLSGVARPQCTFRNLADVPRCARLASVFVVDARGVVRSPARVGRLASCRHDVDGGTVAVLRRHAVPRFDVAVCRRRRSAVVVVTAGAAVSRVQGVAA
jgi:hypothetical protein